MSNKKIFKELYSNKINKDNNYQEILNKIENEKKLNKIMKTVFVPILSVSFASFLILININNKKTSLSEDSFNEVINNNQIFTNEIQEEININTSSNQVIKDTNYEEISNYKFVKELSIPNDFSDKIYRKVYLNNNENNNYNERNYYQIYYKNNKSNRLIDVSFSDKYKLINNYSYDENVKKSKINNQEIIIYQNNQIYITSFNYDNVYFNIKTVNITENEFINLLKSIIK